MVNDDCLKFQPLCYVLNRRFAYVRLRPVKEKVRFGNGASVKKLRNASMNLTIFKSVRGVRIENEELLTVIFTLWGLIKDLYLVSKG